MCLSTQPKMSQTYMFAAALARLIQGLRLDDNVGWLDAEAIGAPVARMPAVVQQMTPGFLRLPRHDS